MKQAETSFFTFEWIEPGTRHQITIWKNGGHFICDMHAWLGFTPPVLIDKCTPLRVSGRERPPG